MELIYHPIINIRTLLIWENITGKQINGISDNEDDIMDMKYASLLSSGAFMVKSTFSFLYGSNEFKRNFDSDFSYAIGYFNSYGKRLFETYTTTELIALLQEKHNIDYETIVNKMTFPEIERLLN